MNNLIDCHTHILPGMDDGAKNIQEAVSMLMSLRKQGVRSVWLTPHYYPYKEDLKSFLSRREKAYSLLQPFAEQLEMELFPASETFLSEYLFNAQDISKLCIGGRYLLTEVSPSSGFSRQTVERIGRLAMTYSVVPILAHVERYPKLWKNRGLLDELLDMECLAQVNFSALDSGVIKRKQVLHYIKTNRVHLVGTDCHGIKKRRPQYANGVSVLEKKLGTEYVRLLMRNARQIMSGSILVPSSA